MSYEYKDTIQDSIIHYYFRVLFCGEHADDILDELDHVYAQAALNKEKIKQIEETYKVRYSEHIELKRKSEEYEAKAKAWDKLNEYVSTTPYDGIDMDTLKNRLNNFMVESGEL